MNLPRGNLKCRLDGLFESRVSSLARLSLKNHDMLHRNCRELVNDAPLGARL
jgi:hypothetical protein